MNKHLNYERSKRLAELGYKPVDPNAAVYADLLVGEEERKEKHFTRYINMETKDPDGEIVSAPDCHDLLMELQKYTIIRLESDSTTEWIIYTDINQAGQYGYDNPVEALGAALIKLLEEKQ
jgi:hypothetical protein